VSTYIYYTTLTGFVNVWQSWSLATIRAMNERLLANVTGRVQMVMFRDFTRRTARRLGLTGYVQNLGDGSVEVVAEGKTEALDELLSEIHKGPALASVEEVRVMREPATNEFSDFEIRYA
jgi:acylphosphatase